MQNSIFYLAGSALIPILRANISAGASCHVHRGLISVVTVGTFPDQLFAFFYNAYLAVVTTLLTIVAFGVKLRVHNVIVNVLHNVKHSFDIILHIGNLNV